MASNIPLFEVRLNGSAASYVVSEDVSESLFNDLDIVFLLADEGMEANTHELFENIRAVFFACLFDLLPTDMKSATTGKPPRPIRLFLSLYSYFSPIFEDIFNQKSKGVGFFSSHALKICCSTRGVFLAGIHPEDVQDAQQVRARV